MAILTSMSEDAVAEFPPAKRSFEDLITFARDCCAGEGKSFKKSEVLSFMRELVAIADDASLMSSTEPFTQPSPSPCEHEPLVHVTPELSPTSSFELHLEEYARLPGRVTPQHISTGAIYLPCEANGYYTKSDAMRLAALLIRMAR